MDHKKEVNHLAHHGEEEKKSEVWFWWGWLDDVAHSNWVRWGCHWFVLRKLVSHVVFEMLVDFMWEMNNVGLVGKDLDRKGKCLLSRVALMVVLLYLLGIQRWRIIDGGNFWNMGKWEILVGPTSKKWGWLVSALVDFDGVWVGRVHFSKADGRTILGCLWDSGGGTYG